jgi:hypothetical protein
MTDTELLVDVTDRVALLTLNRPDSRNALNAALSNALWDAVVRAGVEHRVPQRVGQCSVQGVAAAWPVQRQQCDPVGHLDEKDGLGHSGHSAKE